MLCTTSSVDDEAVGLPSDNPHPPEHLIVLANGILSDPSDWAHFRSQLVNQSRQSFLVYAEKDNVYCKTMGGVDVAGKRLARGVLEVVKQTPSLRRISFVGHSLGGLFVRYALALLYRPGRERSLEKERKNVSQPPKAARGSKSDAEGVEGNVSYTEADQWGGATWRSTVSTDQAEGTLAAFQEADFPPVGTGLGVPECRFINSLAANHNAREPSLQPTKPSAQPIKFPSKPREYQPTEPDTSLLSGFNRQNTKPTSQPSNPGSQSSKPNSQPNKPGFQPTEASSQSTQSTSQPTKPTLQPFNSTSGPSNPIPHPSQPSSQPTNSHSQPTIAGLEPAHLILVAVPHLGVWGRSQWPFARGVHSFERVASSFSGVFLGRTLRQLFLRDRGVAGEPLLLSMTRDSKERPFLSALKAFNTRQMYANVKWDAALGWKTSSVRLDSDLDRVRKECFGRAEKKQWLGERYPYIVHVEDTPGKGTTGGDSYRGGAPDYVFAPSLARQMSAKFVATLQRKRGGVKKGAELDGFTGRLGDDRDRTVESLQRMESGPQRTVEGTKRTHESTDWTDSASQRTNQQARTVGGTERAAEGLGRTHSGTERTVEGSWTNEGTQRTVDATDRPVERTERTPEGTERTKYRPDWTPGMWSDRGKLRTHRWSSEEACRALADRMVVGLHQVSWRKVDVLFHGATGRKYAHQMLIMKDPRQQAAGQGVVNHMIDVLCGRV